MKHIISTLVLACILGLILSDQAQARTWTVEKDGSGDFTVIQDALDAASPGDSVVVGPGRYDDLTPREFQGGTSEAIAWVEKTGITLVGTDRDAVVLGPSAIPPNAATVEWVGIYILDTGEIAIEGLTLEHLFSGIISYASMTVTDVTFQDNWQRGITNHAAGSLTVSDCSFERNSDFGMFLGTHDFNVLVERCRFVDNLEALVARTTQGIVVRDCHFEAPNRQGGAGVNIAWGAYGEVSNCTFGTFPLGGGVGATNANLTLTSNTFAADLSGSVNVWVRDGSFVEATDNEFGGAVDATVLITDRATASFYENHILNLGEYSLRVMFYALPGTYPLHFENNWWGTDDEAQVAQWIYDEPDPPGINATPIWQPILGMPVPTEETSFGSLKARFQSP